MNFQSYSPSPHHRGFTLVEVLIVIGTLAFVLPIITIVLFVVVRQQLTVARMTEVKRQGDQAIAAIQNVLNREVVGMYDDAGLPVCATTTGSVETVTSFKNAAGVTILFAVDVNNALGITRGASIDTITNPEKVIVEDSLSIECFRNAAYTHPLVGISFSIIPQGPLTTLETNATRMRFSTKTMIRR